ncbi:tagatose 6-phosphate kinase [Streptomyces sp. WMMB 714]|uniref:1-phosphofructokinase family hexose kinase n=1 Tax=Streptomyces sp. WMMB 714 TaxID=1286822 RepID=UPI0005F80099|nr:1-phosphofructokinase family hexose kinase [Streptomyces sp. WMMB 714]SCK49837.1 tagatose 6-phosphate kinase [Streptomyces sp. WMMB 714]
MILTVTLNTALDLTYRVPRLDVHGSHQARDVTERPGGKGLNVARVLAALGHATVVTGFAGGRTGEWVRELLGREAGVSDALVPIGGSTRRTVGIVDESTGDATQFNEPGPHIAADEWAAFLDTYGKLLHRNAGAAHGSPRSGDGSPPRGGGDGGGGEGTFGDGQDGGGSRVEAVALCGSLPPGVPVGAYAQLIREAHAADVPVVLDTSGEPLRRGLAARPDLVKPNAGELAGITGTTEPLRAARAAQRRGAHAVAASLGPEGMLLVTPDGTWQASPPRSLTGNPTGAGDSAVAGLISGLVERLPWPERLARAVALSAATVRAATAGEFDEEVHRDLLARVRVEERGEATAD